MRLAFSHRRPSWPEPALSKVDASRRIDELQQITGRGANDDRQPSR
jgi:hypothetical protein